MEIAKTVANSPLVKTAICGRRSELGPDRFRGRLCGRAFRSGRRDPARQRIPALPGRRAGALRRKAVSDSIRDNRDTRIELQFSEGDAKVRFWTTDLTAEYVRLNADYHT